MNTDLRAKTLAIVSQIGADENLFVGHAMISEDAVVGRFVEVFDERRDLLRKFLYPIFDQRIRGALSTITSLNTFDGQTPIKEIFPPRYLRGDLKELAKQTGLVLPEPVSGKLSLFISLGVFLGSCVLAIVAVVMRPEILIVLFGLVKSGVIVVLLFIPNVVVYFLFPALFRSGSLGDIDTYRALTEYVVRRNYYDYVEDQYRLTRQELRRMLNGLK
ncbi:hypothetical protein [Dawidia soli]|uniref:Uncharacterized protein n=1 Tax=Dawidia soli TaxID=2782352 RepID=A0AAP2DFH0_9BACT|nr:hypothetical protein [Dawidia soli]MBT1688392.1 hypothetical protein [Dawidia soli]